MAERKPVDVLPSLRDEPLLGGRTKALPSGGGKARFVEAPSAERDESPEELSESLHVGKDIFPKRATRPSGKKPSGSQQALHEHLLQAHPVDAILMGSAGAGAFVESAIQRAQRYGFERGPDLLGYLDLMVILGHGFDVDPQLTRVTAALRKTSKPSMDEVFEGVLAYLGKVSGETGDVYIKALLRARKCAAMSLVATSCGSASDAAGLLRKIYPEKLAVMQDDLDAAFALAQTLTRRHSEGVRALYLVLMFLLGSHFESDPRYAWAAETLADSRLPGETARYKRLHEEALSRLDFALRARGGLESLAKEVG